MVVRKEKKRKKKRKKEEEEEKSDFVTASKKTGKQKLKICVCNLAFLPANYRKILST